MAICACGRSARLGQRTCRLCHATAMRRHRERLKALMDEIEAHLTKAGELAVELRILRTRGPSPGGG